jgi:two-component system, cell cycle sensor histidine kinase and response regulator CckA
VTDARLATLLGGFPAIVNSYPDAVAIYDLDGKVVDGNPALEQLTGYQLAELLEMNFAALVHPEDLEPSRDTFARAVAGEPARRTMRLTDSAGEACVADVIMTPYRDDRDAIIGVIAIARNVTELQRALEKSERVNATLRFAARMARVGGWAIELPSREVVRSKELVELFGYPGDESSTLEASYSVYPPAQRAEIRAAVEACIAHGEPIDFDPLIRTDGGVERYVRVRGEAVRDASGTIIRIQGAFSDVTEDVGQRETKLRVEELLSTTLNQISDALCFVDRDWTFTFVNASYERLVGASSASLIGASMWDLYPEVWGTVFGRAYRDAMHQGVVTGVRGFYDPFDLWLDARAYPTHDGIAIYLRDITSDQFTLDALHDSDRELREKAKLLDIARDAILVRDLDHRISYWNRAAADLYGWEGDEVTGVSVRELLYTDPTQFDQATEAVVRHGFWAGELHQTARNGSPIIVDARWQLLRDDDGEPYAVLVVNSDVTSAKREEAKLMQAQRLESLGTLAGGIAHDLNNVLTPVLLSVQLLDESETDSGRRQLLNSMETGILRGAEMIKQVLTFARGIEGDRRVIDVSALLGELETLAKYTLPKSIEIRTSVAGELWPVLGDPTQVMQVLVNLVTNAQDAMPDGGRLTMAARNHELDTDYLPTPDGAAPGRYVIVEVEDTGEGMSDDIAARIFEPFFTTKEVGRGTGLGLATSMSIVRSHGGFISLYSEPGGGTRFRVHLPASDSPLAGEPIAPPPDEVPQGSGERILLVDDEEMILATVRRILEDNGYATTVAMNGREAIDTIEGTDEPFDLVVTDMMMPVMGGAETVAYLAEHHPEIAVIAASGLNANGDLARASHPGILEFIDKPFGRVELLQAVRRALDERSRRIA